MKLIELLSRYLSGHRHQRRAARKKSGTQPAAIALTDVELESRILLSGAASGEATAEANVLNDVDGPAISPYEISVTSLSAVSDNTFQISFAAAAGGTAQATLTRTDDYNFSFNAILPAVLGDIASERFDSDLASDINVEPINNLLNMGSESRTSLGEVLTDYFAPSHAEGTISITVNGRLILPDIGGDTSLSPIKNARSTAPPSTPPNDSSASSVRSNLNRDVGEIQSTTGDETTGTVSGDVSQQSIDLFFSNTELPQWIVEDDHSLVPANTSVQQRQIQDSAATVDVARTTRSEEAQTNQLTVSGQRQESASGKSPSARTSVFTTADSKTAFAELLNSLVQFDTSDLLEEDQELTDWLSDQLGLAPIDVGSQDVDLTNTAGSFAEANEPGHSNEQLERLQQAYLKIDYLATPEAFSVILSDQPPEPPEVVSIWQQIRFDCSPRGPPVSDRISGSFVTLQNANAVQLEQLRYSIAPRGPSAVSVN